MLHSQRLRSLPPVILLCCAAGCGGGGGGTATPLPGGIGFDAGTGQSVTEGGSSLLVAVVLDEALDSDLDLRLLASGDAEAADFALSTTELSIATGELFASFEVSAPDDAVFEGDEGLTLTLERTAGPEIELAGAALELAIIDDEPLPQLSFTTADSTVEEAAGADHVVQVALDIASEPAVSFELALEGSATEGVDYLLVAGGGAFDPLELTRDIVLRPIDDGVGDGDETIVLNLVDLNGAEAGVQALHVVELTEVTAPDPQQLLFTATRTDGSRPLVAIDAAGAAPFDVAGLIGTGDIVSDFMVSNDGSQVAFNATVGGGPGIFVAPLAGGSPVRVSPPTTAGQFFTDEFAWSADDQRVAFRLNNFGDNGLWVSSPDGSAMLELVAPTSGRRILSFAWSPTGARIAWVQGTIQGPDIVDRELFTANSDGSDLVSRSGPAGFTGVEDGFRWSADGAELAYLADNVDATRFDVFTVALDGSAPVQRTPLAAGSASGVDYVPGGGRELLFRGRYADAGTFELFLLPADTSAAPLELSDPTVTAEVPADGYAFVPDGTRLAYLSDENSDGDLELTIAEVSGSARAVLDPSVALESFAWSPTSATIAVVGTDGSLRQAPAATSSGALTTLDAGGPIADGPWWSPNGLWLAVRGTNDELRAVSAAASAPSVLQANVNLTLFPGAPSWSADSRTLAFVGENAGPQTLYLADPFVSGSAAAVSGPDLDGIGFWSFGWVE